MSGGPIKCHDATTPAAREVRGDILGRLEVVIAGMAPGVLNPMVIETIPLLMAYDDAPLPNHSVVWVGELLDWFVLEQTSGEAVDMLGYTILLAHSGGTARWHRACQSHQHWRSREEWHIDQAAGDNRNSGVDAAHALQDFPELWRRIGTEPLTVDPLGIGGGYPVVYVHGGYVGDIDFFMEDRYDAHTLGATEGGGLTIMGVMTALHAGSLTAGTFNYAPAGPVVGELEDLALPVSWAASGLVGTLCVLGPGSSVPGAYGWIAKQNGAGLKQARYSPFWDELGFAWIEPQIADTYTCYQFPKIRGNVHAAGAATLVLYNLDLDPGNAWDWPVQSSGASLVFIYGCLISSGHPHVESASNAQFYGCRFGPGVAAVHQTRSGNGDYYCCFFEAPLTSTPPAAATICAPSLFQAVAPVNMSGNINMEAGAWACVQDAPALSTIMVAPEGSISHWYALLWGAGNNANVGIDCTFGLVLYDPALPPAVGPNAVNDWVVHATAAGAWAALPSVNVQGTISPHL